MGPQPSSGVALCCSLSLSPLPLQSLYRHPAWPPCSGRGTQLGLGGPTRQSGLQGKQTPWSLQFLGQEGYVDCLLYTANNANLAKALPGCLPPHHRGRNQNRAGGWGHDRPQD